MYQTTKLAKRLRIALLAICIFALAFALVACGEKDDNNKNTNSSDDFFADDGYFSKSAIESYIAYMITNTGSGKYDQSTIMCSNFSSAEGADFLMTFAINGDIKVALERYSDGYLQNYVDDINNHPGYIIKGNYAIYESVPGIWENEILKATMPANAMPQSRLDFIYDSCQTIYDECSSGRADTFNISFTIYGLPSFVAQCWNDDDDAPSNCETYMGLYSPEDIDDIHEEKYFDDRYTADSYINVYRETGYVFEKLVNKPGFVYDDYTPYGQDESGLEIYDYYYDENSPQNAVVPSMINGKKVLKFDMQNGSRNYVSLELEEGILEIGYIGDSNKLDTLILPKSLTRLGSQPIEDCLLLKTIKYAGTKE